MRFKVDENLPKGVEQILQETGHEATTVLNQKMGGDADGRLAAIRKSENRILLTLDTDFGNILAYPPSDYPGIIVIRTKDQSKPTVLDIVRRIAAAMEKESPQGKLWIVEPAGIRIRGPDD